MRHYLQAGNRAEYAVAPCASLSRSSSRSGIEWRRGAQAIPPHSTVTGTRMTAQDRGQPDFSFPVRSRTAFLIEPRAANMASAGILAIGKRAMASYEVRQ